MLIGEQIKKRRIELGLSRKDLSEKTGISNSYISMLESGDRKSPSLDILLKISTALNYDFTDEKILNSDFRNSNLNSMQQLVFDSFSDFLTCINLSNYSEDLTPEELCDIALSSELSSFLLTIKNKNHHGDITTENKKLKTDIKNKDFHISELKKEIELKNKTIEGLLNAINKIDKQSNKTKANQDYLNIKSFVEKKFPILEEEIKFLSHPKVESFFGFTYQDVVNKNLDELLIKSIEKSIYTAIDSFNVADISDEVQKNNNYQEKENNKFPQCNTSPEELIETINWIIAINSRDMINILLHSIKQAEITFVNETIKNDCTKKINHAIEENTKMDLKYKKLGCRITKYRDLTTKYKQNHIKSSLSAIEANLNLAKTFKNYINNNQITIKDKSKKDLIQSAITNLATQNIELKINIEQSTLILEELSGDDSNGNQEE